MLYSIEQNPHQTDTALMNILEKSIRRVYHLYLYQFLMISRVAAYVEKDRKIKAAKLLKKGEEKTINGAILENSFVQSIIQDEAFHKKIKQEKLGHWVDENVVKKLYKDLTEAEFYPAYANKDEWKDKESRELVKALYKKLMLESELYTDHLEDVLPNWIDDKSVVTAAANNTISQFKKGKKPFSVLSKKIEWKERLDFARELLELTEKHNQEYLDLISPQLTNWEIDRIAKIDILLMKMALCELLYCPTIPVKVTFNEYIDIAKRYSTPKSKDFINGVLDKLLKKLKDEGRINKIGRGLVGS